jgi:hypothetical protein
LEENFFGPEKFAYQSGKVGRFPSTEPEMRLSGGRDRGLRDVLRAHAQIHIVYKLIRRLAR